MSHHSDSLCEICSSLDIYRLYSDFSNEEIDIGDWQSIQRRASKCHFCRLFETAILNGPLGQRASLDDVDFTLIQQLTLTSRCGSDASTSSSRAVRLHVLTTEEFRTAGDILLIGEDARRLNQSPLGHGRLLNSTCIDYRLVRKWIQDCQQLHRKCSNPSLLGRFDITLPKDSLLIDVHRECIVDALPSHEYTTLSYRWGDCEQFLNTRMRLPQLRDTGALLEKPVPWTVRDAMALTKNIGINYLWVDALCIIQDDDAHKAKQIANMHHIYAASTITIVAADSYNANSGLPRVRGNSQQFNQRMALMGGLHVFARANYADSCLNRSEYNKRAWTYQESSISRRLLYVTATGTSMSCCQDLRNEEFILEDDRCTLAATHDHSLSLDVSQRNFWRDVVPSPPVHATQCSHTCKLRHRDRYEKGQLLLRGSSGKSMRACQDCSDFVQKNENDWHLYKNFVSGYTGRNLTFESDRLLGFAGISGILQREFATSFLYGLPEKFLDFALLWRPRPEASVRKQRSLDFPSWSWASAGTYAGFPGDTWVTSEVDWYRVHGDGNLYPIHSLKGLGQYEKLRDDFHRPVHKDQLYSHQLSSDKQSAGAAIFGWCQISPSFHIKDGKLYDRHKQPILMVSGAPQEVIINDVLLERKGDMIPTEVLRISRGHHSPRIEVPGLDELFQFRNHLLLISRQDNTAIRLGTVGLDNEYWEQAEKSWMLIKLI